MTQKPCLINQKRRSGTGDVAERPLREQGLGAGALGSGTGHQVQINRSLPNLGRLGGVLPWRTKNDEVDAPSILGTSSRRSWRTQFAQAESSQPLLPRILLICKL